MGDLTNRNKKRTLFKRQQFIDPSVISVQCKIIEDNESNL